MISDSDFVRFVAPLLTGRFTLIDVGCSGGLSPGWRAFGRALKVFAFDPNIGECERLRAMEPLPDVHYEAGFVGIPPRHPFAAQRRGRPPLTRSPWDRLAVARTLKMQSAKVNAASEESRTRANLWQSVQLAEPDKPIYLTEYLAQHDVQDVDFVKIDIDGNDYDVLNSLDGVLDTWQVLGLLLEVNYVGSADKTEHTFHNTDRFMRTKLFDLFDLSVRRYSSAALPSPYCFHKPGPTFGGRPLQGDALYLRDLANPDIGPRGNDAAPGSIDKVLKLAALFSLFDLPDCAAEVLIAFRDRLEGHLDIARGLDLLALQSQRDFSGRRSYTGLMTAFNRDAGSSYPWRVWPAFHAYRELKVAVGRVVAGAARILLGR